MISTILFAVFFAVAFFSAENLISIIVGGLVTLGVTHVFKQWTGLQGAGAAIVAMLISLVIAIIAYVLSTVLSGDHISAQMIPQAAAYIFTLATMAYKLLMADSQPAV